MFHLNRKRKSYDLRKGPIKKKWWIFLLPLMAAFFIGFVWPFIQGIYLSFCTFTTTSDATVNGFNGKAFFNNYLKAFNDPTFVRSFWYSALFAVVSLIIINVLAFTVAYFLTKELKGSNLFRTVFFMPNLIGGIVLGYIWSMIFDGILHMYGKTLVTEPVWGFWGLVVVVAWQQIGYMMIIYIAGLQAVPSDMLEAAKIDGANSWQTLWRVTIPNVMPSITICTFLSLTNGFKLFDQNLALTNGLPKPFVNGVPVGQTEMIALNIYNTFYVGNTASRGTAQAKAVLFFILVAGLGLIQLSTTRRREVQQ